MSMGLSMIPETKALGKCVNDMIDYVDDDIPIEERFPKLNNACKHLPECLWRSK
jgi:hypothetical protein